MVAVSLKKKKNKATETKPDKKQNKTKETETAPIFNENDAPPFEIEDRQKISQNDTNKLYNEETLSLPDNNAICPASYEESKKPFEAESADELIEASKAPEDGLDSGTKERNTSSKLSGVEWADILASLRKTMQPGQYNIISNEQMASGELSDDTLTVSVQSAFVKGQLEQPQVMDFIKNSAREVMGRTVIVKVLENKPIQSQNEGKLDSLSRFENVKFE